MNKLKKEKINNLLNYQHFLKNNFLKKKKLKLKNILFENQILYKNKDLNIIELNNSENIYIPITVTDLKNINTIDILYENQQLFNYNLNYNILYNYNKIMFNYMKKKNNNIIKGRVIISKDHKNKKTLLAVLGFVFSMKSKNLNNLINNKKDFYRKNFNKNKLKYRNKNFSYNLRKMKIKKIIQTYKLRYLNFKIEKIKNNNLFSRISYLDEIIKYLRIKKERKIMILEKRKEKKKAIFLEKYMKKKKFNK